MRILCVADLHYALPQFDWLVKAAPRFDLVIIAGDLLDGNSMVTTSAQMVTVLKYLERLRDSAPLLVCSGNHDLNHAYSTGERYARWIQYARGPQTHVDGDTVTIGDIAFTIFPWWDGDLAKAAIGRQLSGAGAGAGDRQWWWIYHAPPPHSPVSWSGFRHYGDEALAGWIGQYRPAVVFSGHVHEAPFATPGGWIARVGGTIVLNPGRQIGDMPTHICIDTERREAAWFSLEGAESASLASDAAPAAPLTAMPAWMPI
jgi:Icc-related predicted phosphoesterase